MVNIDDPSGEFRAERFRDDLHVTREHDEIGTRLAQSPGHRCERRGFVLRRHRHVQELEAFALDHVAEVGVIRNDERNVEHELAGAPAPEQVREAVAEFRHHENDAHFFRRIAQRPIGTQLRGERLECGAQRRHAFAQRAGLDRQPREEPLRKRVGELMHLEQIPTVPGHERRDAREQPDAIGAGEAEDDGGHWEGVRRQETGVSAQWKIRSQ